MPRLRPSTVPDNSAPAALPPDVRAMNAIAALVCLLAAAGVLAAGAAWLARRPFFAFSQVRLEGDLQRSNAAAVRANALPRLTGNFFTLDLAQARAAFESVPWVRRAVVRRLWPNRLVVTLEEHQPVALWDRDENSDRMVNRQGEVFEANVGDVEDDSLPGFSGPDGSSGQVLAMYERLAPVLAPLKAEVAALALSGRGSWRLELDTGAVVELGRGGEDEVVSRAARFARTVGEVLGRFQAPLENADLRHADGYAVKLKGVAVSEGAKPPAAP